MCVCVGVADIERADGCDGALSSTPTAGRIVCRAPHVPDVLVVLITVLVSSLRRISVWHFTRYCCNNKIIAVWTAMLTRERACAYHAVNGAISTFGICKTQFAYF